MHTILPVKISLKNLDLQNPDFSLDKLSVLISSNSFKNIYKYPFEEMVLHIINFPKNHFLSVTLLSDNSPVCFSELNISELEHKDVFITEAVFHESTEKASADFSQKKSCTIQITKNQNKLAEVIAEYSDIDLSALKIALTLAKNTKENKYEISEFLNLDDFDFQDFQEITPQTVKNIRYLLLGINEKLKVVDILKEKLKESEDNLAKELSKKEQMRDQFRKTCLEFLSDKQKSEKQISVLEEKVKILLFKLKNQEEQAKLFEDFKENKEIEIEKLKLKIETAGKGQVHSIEFPEELVFDRAENTQHNIPEEIDKMIKDLLEENEELRVSLKKSLEKNNVFESDMNEIKQEVIFLTGKMIEYESQLDYHDELQSQYDRIERDLRHYREHCESLQSQLRKINEEYMQTTKQLYLEKQQLTELNKKLSQDFSENKTELITLQNKYFELQSKSYNNSYVNTVSYTILTEQNRQLLEDSKNFCLLTNDLELKIIQDNSLMVKSFLSISQNYLMLQRLLNCVLLYLRDKDLENGLLRESCNLVQKQKVVYVPIRNDFIDNQLANFINSSPVPIEVPFVRVDNGIYLFGTKRVVLRVENVGISIRVGGGYITLEQFISSQTQFEVGKIKERLQKSKSSVPGTSFYKSPTPQAFARVGSPKHMTSPKIIKPKSPKALPIKKNILNSTVKISGRRATLL